MFRPIPEFPLYEMNELKTIRHVVTKNIKSPHRGGDSVRLYVGNNELSRKIDKLFNITFPELVKGSILTGYSMYRVLSSGEIYGMYEAKVLKPAKTKDGYLRVSVRHDDGTTSSQLVHRLVAKTFIPNTHNKEDINHIDGNKANNDVTNLEWVTASENLNHAVKTGLYDTKLVKCKVSKGTEEYIFNSIKDTSDFLSCSTAPIRSAMNRNKNNEVNTRHATGKFTCKGYIVEHVN